MSDFEKKEGIRIVFAFANREYAADCYNLNDVSSFLDDLSTDFTEDGQLTLKWYGPETDHMPCTFHTEVCVKNIPRVKVKKHAVSSVALSETDDLPF